MFLQPSIRIEENRMLGFNKLFYFPPMEIHKYSTESNNKKNETLLSDVISFLRFPLIVGVVFIHSEPNLFFQGNPGIYYSFLYSLFSCVIAGCAVPLFFMFSGYLFFKNGFDANIYLTKLRKRAKTILTPYILWNLIGFGLLLLSQQLTESNDLTRGLQTPLDYLNIFWAYRSSYPMCAQFWFLRDLMMMFMVSPIVFIAIKYLRHWFIWGLIICWIFGFWINIVGFSVQAVLFFSMGAYFGVNKINFVVRSKQFLKYTSIIYIALSVGFLCGYDDYHGIISRSSTILVGIFAILGLVAYLIDVRDWKENRFLTECSFFIYASHQVFLGMITKRTLPFLININQELGFVISYIACPTVVIICGVVLYKIMRVNVPIITGVLVGERNQTSIKAYSPNGTRELGGV